MKRLVLCGIAVLSLLGLMVGSSYGSWFNGGYGDDYHYRGGPGPRGYYGPRPYYDNGSVYADPYYRPTKAEAITSGVLGTIGAITDAATAPRYHRDGRYY